MPNVKDCPGFENFGADVQQAREVVGMSRRELAERVGIDPRYLANIELCGTIPGVPVVMQLCPEKYLPATEIVSPATKLVLSNSVSPQLNASGFLTMHASPDFKRVKSSAESSPPMK